MVAVLSATIRVRLIICNGVTERIPHSFTYRGPDPSPIRTGFEVNLLLLPSHLLLSFKLLEIS